MAVVAVTAFTPYLTLTPPPAHDLHPPRGHANIMCVAHTNKYQQHASPRFGSMWLFADVHFNFCSHVKPFQVIFKRFLFQVCCSLTLPSHPPRPTLLLPHFAHSRDRDPPRGQIIPS